MARAVRQEDIECDTVEMMPTDSRSALKMPKCGRQALTFFGGAASGAIVALVVASLVGVQLSPQALQAAPPSLRSYGDQDVEGPSLSFGPSKANDVLGELSSGEIQAIAKWLQETGIDGVKVSPVRDGSPYWLGGLEAIQLLPPPKSEVLAYVDSNGPLPPRFARVRVVGPEDTMEYSVGPLSNGELEFSASAKPLLSRGAVPPVKRPMDHGGDNELALGLENDIMKELGESMLVGVFGPIFPQFKSYDASKGTITTYLRNEPLLSNSTARISTRKMLWSPPAPTKPESQWLYPLPLQYRMDTTATDWKQWKAFEFKLCGQTAPTAKALRAAYEDGSIKGCPITYNTTGNWSFPQRTTKPDPAGRVQEEHRGVSWGPWNFTVEQRPGTGLALFDVRFRGERILYELSLQEAHAAYAGALNDQFYFADASFSMSQMSASLEPGVDCPKGARYLSASKWIGGNPAASSGHPAVLLEARPEFADPAGADPTKATDFWPICVFDFEEDHTIWRHMQNADQTVSGLIRRTVVVRSIATVGNYDYMMDVSMREDGEIEVHTRFAGYAETRYFNKDVNPEEEKYSTIIHPGLAGPVHSHIVSWKADFDIAGQRSNAMKVTKVKSTTLPEDKALAGPVSTKYLEHSIVEKEGQDVSTFVACPKTPGVWSIVDRNSVSPTGNPRGYAITLASFATLQVLPDDHPFTRSQPFTKYHVAVTKHHDDEYRANSPYDLYDASDPSMTQNLDRFLSDGESLLDEDLVAWIGVGKEHITRQEDLPLVSNFGTAFSLQPWNFHLGNVASN